MRQLFLDQHVLDLPFDSDWSRGFSNQASPPRMSRFPGAHYRTFASDSSCIKSFSSSSGPVPPDQRELELIVCCVLHLFLVARHVRFPSFNPCSEFQQRALSRRNDRAKQISLSSSCRRVASVLQFSPGLQRFLPRVGGTVIGLIPRESHKCCVHPLQHEHQIGHTSLDVRRSRQEFWINYFLSDFRDLFS